MYSKDIWSHFYACHCVERQLIMRMMPKLNFLYRCPILFAITEIYCLFQECSPYSALCSTTVEEKQNHLLHLPGQFLGRRALLYSLNYLIGILCETCCCKSGLNVLEAFSIQNWRQICFLFKAQNKDTQILLFLHL